MASSFFLKCYSSFLRLYILLYTHVPCAWWQVKDVIAFLLPVAAFMLSIYGFWYAVCSTDTCIQLLFGQSRNACLFTCRSRKVFLFSSVLVSISAARCFTLTSAHFKMESTIFFVFGCLTLVRCRPISSGLLHRTSWTTCWTQSNLWRRALQLNINSPECFIQCLVSINFSFLS